MKNQEPILLINKMNIKTFCKNRSGNIGDESINFINDYLKSVLERSIKGSYTQEKPYAKRRSVLNPVIIHKTIINIHQSFSADEFWERIKVYDTNNQEVFDNK